MEEFNEEEMLVYRSLRERRRKLSLANVPFLHWHFPLVYFPCFYVPVKNGDLIMKKKKAATKEAIKMRDEAKSLPRRGERLTSEGVLDAI